MEQIRRESNLRYFMGVILVTVIISGLFLISRYGHTLGGDECQYEILGWNLAAGHGYSLSPNAPYELTAFREPGYPLFIALIYKIFGRKYIFVYLAQILLSCFTCILTFKISKEIFNLQIAKYSAILAAICPTLTNYSVIFYSESFFTFLLLTNIYFTILAKKTGNLKWFMLSAATLALMALTKTAMIFFSIFIISFYFLDRNKEFSLKSYIMNIIISIFLFAIILTPWVIRNYRLFGIKNLNSRGEMVLLMRALKLDYSTEKTKAAYVYYISEYLGAKFFPNAVGDPRDFMLEDDHAVYEMEKNLLRQEQSRAKISSTLRRQAISKIMAHPFRYIFQTPLEFIKLMAFMHIPLLFDVQVIDKFKNINNGVFLLSIIRGLYKFIGYFIVLFVAIGIYIRRREWRQHFIILAIILYINGIYSLLNGYPRFSVPLIPFYFMYLIISLRGDKNRKCLANKINE